MNCQIFCVSTLKLSAVCTLLSFATAQASIPENAPVARHTQKLKTTSIKKVGALDEVNVPVAVAATTELPLSNVFQDNRFQSSLPRQQAQGQPLALQIGAKSKLENKGLGSVACTAIKEGRGDFEVANIVCKNNTDAIQTVFVNISATGYSGTPSPVVARNGFLLSVGESRRVARLKVVSRPAKLSLNFTAMPFKTITLAQQ